MIKALLKHCLQLSFVWDRQRLKLAAIKARKGVQGLGAFGTRVVAVMSCERVCRGGWILALTDPNELACLSGQVILHCQSHTVCKLETFYRVEYCSLEYVSRRDRPGL